MGWIEVAVLLCPSKSLRPSKSLVPLTVVVDGVVENCNVRDCDSKRD